MVQREYYWGWSLGGVIGSGLIFPRKMSLQQLWRNVNLGLRASNRQQWNYITFFPQSFL